MLCLILLLVEMQQLEQILNRVFKIKSDVFQKEIANSKSNIERFEKDAHVIYMKG